MMINTYKTLNINNPYINILKDFSVIAGEKLVNICGISNAYYTLGGSLMYDAMQKDEYDIDLRLLIPDVGKSVEEVHREIDAVKDLMVERAKGDPSFSVRFIDEGGKNYIWHTKQIVKVPGIPGDPDVWLAWNIQAESTYRGIAEMASRLPRELIDRYVVAKWEAREKSESVYSETKKQWVDFIDWIIDKGGKGMNEKELKKLLEDNPERMPSFLK